MKRVLFILIILAIAGGGVGAAAKLGYFSDKTTTSFRTVTVKRGDVLATISATGTIEPEEVVDVGAQVAGKITGFGNDANGKQIDYGSPVEPGMLLAQIDASLYNADEASAEAQLESDKAGILRAQADLNQQNAKLTQAQADWNGAQMLGPSEALARTQYDQYKADYEVAKANVGVSEAALKQAESTVKQSEAAMVRVKQNLDYCTISSPVKGIIIDRRVNVGQTVVASLNAPSLFLIAKDLTKMQLWVPVNEADIGHVHAGQNVTFTVDAFSGETFYGTVGKVRLNAVMTQNVVTYTVEVDTDNSSGRLLPYLTANVQFEVGKHEDVVLVPNAALRWSPRPEQIKPGETDSDSAAGGAAGSAGGGGRRNGSAAGGRGRRNGQDAAGGPTTRKAPAEDTSRGIAWVQDGDFAKPIRLRLGLTDGVDTEVLSDNLPEGAEVITGEQRADTSVSGPVTPFMPQFGGRGGGRRG
jgi:HlyD family secretion protein